MAKVSVNFKIDELLKSSGEVAMKNAGCTPTQEINKLYEYFSQHGRSPFATTQNTLNERDLWEETLNSYFWLCSHYMTYRDRLKEGVREREDANAQPHFFNQVHRMFTTVIRKTLMLETTFNNFTFTDANRYLYECHGQLQTNRTPGEWHIDRLIPLTSAIDNLSSELHQLDTRTTISR
ncbi:hypothetical protein [Serratia sp. UGAL515B_01]|uniref:hypothetical protein n=1 Tax=Serratia sp. UGAL515B_01 TaxID=2986763 RepID=UPI0029539D0B|nr:hypothetical protein [Serratia sp. UGAL515B_01]WON78048.1 hypothetical protein OK023_05080 [Serratia sp. UGAL515B_01]